MQKSGRCLPMWNYINACLLITSLETVSTTIISEKAERRKEEVNL